MRVLIAGCGYVGCRLGEELVRAGHVVAGIRRPGSDPTLLRALGIEPLAIDLSERGSLDALPDGWDAVVFCAAPSEGGEAAYRRVYLDGARHLVDRLRDAPPRRMVFTSSTGVYPQNDGSEVDETASVEGVTGTGAVLRAAEDVFLAAAEGMSAVVLRVAGIYGPGRNRIAAVRRGEVRVFGEGDRWMNMIHREDLVGVLCLALERGDAGGIYNVSDGAPCLERDFYGWLTRRLGVAMGVPVLGAGVGAGRAGRSVTNKRVKADRVRAEWGWTPRYPDFRAGYEAELASGA